MGSLPTVTSKIPNDLKRFLERVREAIEGRMGLVSKQDLVDAGIALASTAGELSPAVVSATGSTPPAPTSLTATGAMTAIILEWNGTGYTGHSLTEIWRASTDDLGTAVLIGTSPGELYTDATGSDAVYYYWARFINTSDDTGAFNATAGVIGTTAPDLSYVMSMLSEAYGTGSEAPFFQLDAATEINGVEIPAGTYMKSAMIHEAFITNAMIGVLSAAKITTGTMHGDRITANTLSADRLVVSTLAAVLANITTAYIDEAHIGSGAVTNQKIGNVIQSDSYVAGTAGWMLDKTGNLEANDAVFRGTLDVKSAASGARQEITNTYTKIYDVTGTLRYQHGDLTA